MSARTKGPRIVALLNQKGGVGKTTTTVNLGAGLAAAGLRTLLVDMDPQSNLSLHFGVEADDGRPTTSSLFADPPAKAADCVVKGRDNLSFIPADTELALVEGELAGRDGVQGVLRDALATLACPVQVIWGERDAIIPAEQAAGLPAAVRTEVLPGIGHLLHLEAANAVNALLLRQLG